MHCLQCSSNEITCIVVILLYYHFSIFIFNTKCELMVRNKSQLNLYFLVLLSRANYKNYEQNKTNKVSDMIHIEYTYIHVANSL